MSKPIINKNTRWYTGHGFHLDLSYIMPNVIAMSFPFDNAAGLVMNNINDVVRFLDQMHGEHYLVFNLCAEISYDAAKFHGRVVRFQVKDFNPPPLAMLKEFCQQADSWLRSHPNNVIAVHCRMGKGRTGTFISSFLLYKCYFNDADSAINYFVSKRLADNQMPLWPSQRRYVRYICRLVRNPSDIRPQHLKLWAVELQSLAPDVDLAKICPLYFEVECRSTNTRLTSKSFSTARGSDNRSLLMKLRDTPNVFEDVRIRFYSQNFLAKRRLFWTWFHTSFLGSSPSAFGPSCPHGCANDAVFCGRVQPFTANLHGAGGGRASGFVDVGGRAIDGWYPMHFCGPPTSDDGSRRSGACLVSVLPVKHEPLLRPTWERPLHDGVEMPRQLRQLTVLGHELDKRPRKMHKDWYFTHLKVTVYFTSDQ